MPNFTTTTVGGVRVPTSANNGTDLALGLKTMADDITPGIVTALPGSPVDGQMVFFQSAAMATANMAPWHLRYRSGSSSAHKWEAIGGGTMDNDVDTMEDTSTSGTVVDLTTVGPQSTAPLSGDYMVEFGARAFMQNSSGSAQDGGAIVSLEVAGTPIARDAQLIGTVAAGKLLIASIATSAVVAAAAGDVLKMRYFESGISLAHFSNRYLRVRPLRVG